MNRKFANNALGIAEDVIYMFWTVAIQFAKMVNIYQVIIFVKLVLKNVHFALHKIFAQNVRLNIFYKEICVIILANKDASNALDRIQRYASNVLLDII
jgi:hypothetical protein